MNNRTWTFSYNGKTKKFDTSQMASAEAKALLAPHKGSGKIRLIFHRGQITVAVCDKKNGVPGPHKIEVYSL